MLPFQSKKKCTFTNTVHPQEQQKQSELFKKHTHTRSLARPASGQQHHVTTSPHFADEWLQLRSSCWWRDWCGSACRWRRTRWSGSPTYSQSKNLQECTAHSKLLHNSPQRGDGERKDMGGYIDDKKLEKYLQRIRALNYLNVDISVCFTFVFPFSF